MLSTREQWRPRLAGSTIEDMSYLSPLRRFRALNRGTNKLLGRLAEARPILPIRIHGKTMIRGSSKGALRRRLRHRAPADLESRGILGPVGRAKGTADGAPTKTTGTNSNLREAVVEDIGRKEGAMTRISRETAVRAPDSGQAEDQEMATNSSSGTNNTPEAVEIQADLQEAEVVETVQVGLVEEMTPEDGALEDREAAVVARLLRTPSWESSGS